MKVRITVHADQARRAHPWLSMSLASCTSRGDILASISLLFLARFSALDSFGVNVAAMERMDCVSAGESVDLRRNGLNRSEERFREDSGESTRVLVSDSTVWRLVVLRTAAGLPMARLGVADEVLWLAEDTDTRDMRRERSFARRQA